MRRRDCITWPAVALLCGRRLPAQDWAAEARALRPADTKAAQQAVLDDLEQRAKAALDRIPHARTPAEADRSRPELRRKLEESLGFRRLPWPPALGLTNTGGVRRDGYRIEKLTFQSLPGVRVAAHLYLPEKLDGPAPAVLFYVGHWWPDSKMRPDFQAFCINMARMGFVVLSFDPFGQGERGVSSRDHRRTETLLAGISQQGIAEYETRCALEVLLARKEVDPKRIGMTGASGGGYNTWITGALDDRISVVVPVVGTSDFYEQIHVTRPLDWYRAAEHCHFVPGLIRYANNHEFVSMVAPRPLMIISASVDQSFPVKGVRDVHEYGRSLYRSYQVGEKIAYFEDSSEGHGYQKAKREAAYGWFLKWLMHRGDGKPVAEPQTATEAFDSPELRSFSDGQKAAAGPGIVDYVKTAMRNPPAARTSIESLMGGTPPRAVRSITISDKRVQRVLFQTQDGINVPAVVMRPAKPSGVLVAIDDRGKEELASDPLIQSALQRNWMVWAVDPRGIGESKTQNDGWVFAVSLLLGENFVYRQGADIAQVMEQAGKARLALYARGHNASLAATYALSMTKRVLQWAVLRDGFVSFRQFVERPQSEEASFRLQSDDVRDQRKLAFDREIPHENFVYRAWDAFDLPELLARARTKVTVVDPINGDWSPMTQTDARALLPSKIALSNIDGFIASKW